MDRIRPCRASPSHLARTAPNHPCGSFSRSTDLPVFRLPVPKLAVQGRYNQNLFLSVLSRSLQGIAERPLPCNYNVIHFHGGNTGSNPVGDAKHFQRVTATPNFFIGTKRHNLRPECGAHRSGNTDFSRTSNLFLQAQKGTTPATAAQPPRESEARNSRMTSL